MEILSTVRECMTRAVEAAEAKEHQQQQQQQQQGPSTTAAVAGEGGTGGARGSVVGRVKAVGLTNQRETTVVWRRSTGQPLHNALVWMDTRTSPICRSARTWNSPPWETPVPGWTATDKLTRSRPGQSLVMVSSPCLCQFRRRCRRQPAAMPVGRTHGPPLLLSSASPTLPKLPAFLASVFSFHPTPN